MLPCLETPVTHVLLFTVVCQVNSSRPAVGVLSITLEPNSTTPPLSSQPIINQAGMPQGPSDQKVVVVSVDNCDTSVALRFGHVIGNYTCSAQGSQSGSKK